MLWLHLSILTALMTALSDAISKGMLSGLNRYQMAAARVMAPLVFLLPILAAVGVPELKEGFWTTVALLLPLESLALVLYMEAIRNGELSLTLPMLAFTPAFIIVTGAIFLNETLSAKGVAGIALVVAGSYLLHAAEGWQSRRAGWTAAILRPIKSLLSSKGPLTMLAVAAIYSVTSVLGKRAIMLSDPTFFAAFYFTAHGIFANLSMAVLFRVKPLDIARSHGRAVLLLGLCQAAMVICHMAAISLAPAAYMIAVKRTSVLFGVLFGCLVFREKGLKIRLTAAAIMVSGVFLIAGA